MEYKIRESTHVFCSPENPTKDIRVYSNEAHIPYDGLFLHGGIAKHNVSGMSQGRSDGCEKNLIDSMLR